MEQQGFGIDTSGLQPYRVYRELELHEQTCIFADPAEGRDYCAAVLVSKKYADFPFVYNLRTESSQFGYDLNKIGKYVFQHTGIWPTIAVERNTGQATIHVLNELNYPDMFRMRVFDHSTVSETQKIGWTTNMATRQKMLDDLALSVRQGILKIYDREILNQMASFVIKKKKGMAGRAEAEVGKNDDLVIALAGAWQLYSLVPMFDFEEGQTKEELSQEKDKWRFR